MLVALAGMATACGGGASHRATPPPLAARSTTTTTTESTTPVGEHALPPISLGMLPVPSHYRCSPGLYFLAPANQAVGECIQYSYLVGGTVSDPDNRTACPAGSGMAMGPVECIYETGIVAPVPPAPDTCSTPGGPCPSAKLALSSRTPVLAWSGIRLPTGQCPTDYYFGEDGGVATCVPYGYLPGGTAAHPNGNTSCPAGSALKPIKLTGTLCAQVAYPYDIVAPVPATTLIVNGYLHVTYRQPWNWTPNPGTAPGDAGASGPGGFIELGPGNTKPFTLSEACANDLVMAAQHGNSLGSAPKVVSGRIDGHPACFVIPSNDAPLQGFGTQGRFQYALAHIQYRIPLGGGPWLFLGLVADPAHLLSIAESISFTDGY